MCHKSHTSLFWKNRTRKTCKKHWEIFIVKSSVIDFQQKSHINNSAILITWEKWHEICKSTIKNIMISDKFWVPFYFSFTPPLKQINYIAICFILNVTHRPNMFIHASNLLSNAYSCHKSRSNFVNRSKQFHENPFR